MGPKVALSLLSALTPRLLALFEALQKGLGGLHQEAHPVHQKEKPPFLPL
ncbi:hypothetical protein, partial [Streptomyces sp. P17]